MIKSIETPLSDSPSPQWANRLWKLEIIFLHLLVILVPFFFTWVNEELFEFNKMILTYILVSGALAAWLGQMILRRQLIFKRTPFDIPIGLFVASQILSTIFSIHPYTSFYGYYSRFHGSLLSTFAYVSLYYVVVSTLNKKTALSLLRSALIGGLGAALYAIPEHFGVSPSCIMITDGKAWNDACWVQDVQNRIFGTFGQPNWLAAYVITLFPPALVLFWQNCHEYLATQIKKVSWRTTVLYGLTCLAFIWVLLFTKSRSGLLGMAGGLGVMAIGTGLLVLQNKIDTQIRRSLVMTAVIAALAGGASMVWFGTPLTPSLSSLFHQASTSVTTPTNDTQLEAGGTESGEIRKIVWLGALKVWQRYPILGSGVETFAYSYYQDRPQTHNLVSEWDFLYNKAHNEELQFLSTTGIVGLGTYLLVLGWICVWSLRRSLGDKTGLSIFERLLLLSLVAGIVALSISNFFGFSTVMVTVIMYLFFALAAIMGQSPEKLAVTISWPKIETAKLKWWQIGLVMLLIFSWLSAWWSTANWWLADYDYAYSKKLFSQGYVQDGLAQITTAINRRPSEALYYDQLASDYAQLAIAYNRDNQASVSAELNDAAIASSQETLSLNPRHLNFYKSQARIYITLAQLHPEYLTQAREVLTKATTLAPTDPKVRYNLGLVEEAAGDLSQAEQDMALAVQLKPDYQDARLELADVLSQEKKYQDSAQQYQYVLDHIAPGEPSVLAKLQTTQASAAAQLKKK